MKKTLLLILTLTFALTLAGFASAYDSYCEEYDFNCDGVVNTDDGEVLADIFEQNFNFDSEGNPLFDKYDIHSVKCLSLRRFLERNYDYENDVLSINIVTNTINKIVEECSCSWTPNPDDSAHWYAEAGHNSILFLNGYYEKRLLCWEGKWRTPKYELDWHGWFEAEGEGDWRIEVAPRDTKFEDWKIVDSDFWQMKWIEEEGSCFWPLGTRDNPTKHDDILTINGEEEPRLLCYNGEWYKTRHEDFLPFTSERDVFPTEEGDKVGSWINEDGIWQKLDKDDGKKLILPISGIGEFCEIDWQCTGWSECSNGIMTRQCYDRNNCMQDLNKPIEATGCEIQDSTIQETEQDINYTAWMIAFIIVALIVILILVAIVNSF